MDAYIARLSRIDEALDRALVRARAAGFSGLNASSFSYSASRYAVSLALSAAMSACRPASGGAAPRQAPEASVNINARGTGAGRNRMVPSRIQDTLGELTHPLKR